MLSTRAYKRLVLTWTSRSSSVVMYGRHATKQCVWHLCHQCRCQRAGKSYDKSSPLTIFSQDTAATGQSAANARAGCAFIAVDTRLGAEVDSDVANIDRRRCARSGEPCSLASTGPYTMQAYFQLPLAQVTSSAIAVEPEAPKADNTADKHSADFAEKMCTCLATLNEMGFCDTNNNAELLMRHKFSVAEVINVYLSE